MNIKLQEFELASNSGIKLKFLNYAGAVTSLSVNNGAIDHEVVVGLGDYSNYLIDQASFGAIVGRFANRIKDGKFQLDGKSYQLELNNNGNHLHGGSQGLHKSFMNVEIISPSHARLTTLLPEGVSGYDGNLSVSINYIVTEQNEWIIRYEAETDQPTPINLTSHGYFNLGVPLGEHELTIHAANFLAIDERSIPLEQAPSPVKNTPFDFTKSFKLAERMHAKDEQVALVGGFDHCFVKGEKMSTQPELIAEVSAPGIRMDILTTEPGVQLFTANFEEPLNFPDGTRIEKHCAFCLETQHFPNSPNRPDFPSTILRPGEKFQSETIHRFSFD